MLARFHYSRRGTGSATRSHERETKAIARTSSRLIQYGNFYLDSNPISTKSRIIKSIGFSPLYPMLCRGIELMRGSHARRSSGLPSSPIPVRSLSPNMGNEVNELITPWIYRVSKRNMNTVLTLRFRGWYARESEGKRKGGHSAEHIYKYTPAACVIGPDVISSFVLPRPSSSLYRRVWRLRVTQGCRSEIARDRARPTRERVGER